MNTGTKICAGLSALLLLTVSVPAFAADNVMGMSGPKSAAKTPGYMFELAGPAKSAGGGKSTVAVRLMHDGKPVPGAIIIQSHADMGPINMASMTAPIKLLGEQPPGTYRFEIDNGPVWSNPDNWALNFSAKIQGVAQTVSGSVVVKLAP